MLLWLLQSSTFLETLLVAFRHFSDQFGLCCDMAICGTVAYSLIPAEEEKVLFHSQISTYLPGLCSESSILTLLWKYKLIIHIATSWLVQPMSTLAITHLRFKLCLFQTRKAIQFFVGWPLLPVKEEKRNKLDLKNIWNLTKTKSKLCNK